ncbi:glycosyltransferase family 1 protein [Psychrobacter urativorans]|uniref:glycosyltransferase family 1 protein n=1 Tax=Psychrobacter urativorans TaxID=45610 RepID=UPI00191A2862|nr:glycosyltransferase family 1 protein [Psychrobacter urativorans]
MAPQRTLHIVGRMDRAGAETMLMNLYRHIDRNQIQFDFVTFTGGTGDYDAEIKKLGGRVFPILANNPIERMLRLKRLLQQNPEYKVVHAHMLLSNAFHLLAAKSAGVKNRISHAHNTSNGQPSVIKKVYEKWALITNRQVATHKIACGELAAQYLFGTTENVWLLPNAVDIREMTTIAKKSRDFISQEFSDNGLKVIQVGRLSNVKNHQFSLEIAEQLKKRKVNFTLYIVGQGPLEDQLKQHVKDKSLSDNIIFLGVRDDITELMASADYMIMPSLHEGFPVVLVESHSVGLTAIVSDQVSSEVDLGLGLVDFLPINSAEVWADRLLEPKRSTPSEEEVLDVLRSCGFDVSLNAKKLAQFYLEF